MAHDLQTPLDHRHLLRSIATNSRPEHAYLFDPRPVRAPELTRQPIQGGEESRMSQVQANHRRLQDHYLRGDQGPFIEPRAEAISDWELIANFARLAVRQDQYVLDIAVVDWDGHRPYLRWTAFQGWFGLPSLAQRLESAARALDDDRFFRFCYWCCQRNNRGHMSGISLEESDTSIPICQGCAERFFGVVY